MHVQLVQTTECVFFCTVSQQPERSCYPLWFPIKLNLSSPTTKFCFKAQGKFPFHQIGEKEKGAEAEPICLADPELSQHRRAHNRVSLQQSSSAETKTGPSIHSFPAALGDLLFLISPGVEGKRALVASLTTLSMC